MRKVEEKVVFITVLTIRRIIRLIQNGHLTAFSKTILNMFWRIVHIHNINHI